MVCYKIRAGEVRELDSFLDGLLFAQRRNASLSIVIYFTIFDRRDARK
ncbi:hypothetical protein CHCC20331_4220 [Bacillus paralicheniformis]|uniref:Uncharacterized protein n=1 Tax=Bacillus paralicheniformis TaxID=1648923 RepID=A0ABY3FS79_9BACI|nr:hypothetical protein SC10_B2orf06176 [Bacillus paralicheniformis]TWJ38306.1 hypothetical protein CHCC5027_1069 [Bacillus paralicheniformis]TWJ75434.1 hypothetical protein CHCC5019_2105 [Bacillus paralicheniformis]TWK38452.1 hypothetical protein CHCC20348_3864 [Bacillus paralicheniformis]TWK81747.1 hypothetical protein CHCC20331_4220 [Bacillus paralicheniformis]